MNRRYALSWLVTVLVVTTATFLASTPEHVTKLLPKVDRVIDGDTFVLSDGRKVRLIGIDAPESNDPQKPVEYFAKEAKEHLTKLIEGKRVNLQFDGQSEDKYGRILAYVTVDDTVFVNLEMVRLGLATSYLKYPHSKEEQFLEAELLARREGIGLWSSPRSNAGLATDRPASTTGNESVIVYATRTGKKYHRGTCRYLSKSKIPIMLSGAAKRYGPCGVCSPPVLTTSESDKPKVEAKETSGKTYWINSSSNVRHNKSCRYYTNTKRGYFTDGKSGRACGTCGG